LRGQASVLGGGPQVAVGGDHDGLGVCGGFDGGEVDGVVSTEGMGVAEVAGLRSRSMVVLTRARSANKASSSVRAMMAWAGDSRPR
jgi:hypothetical protein